MGINSKDLRLLLSLVQQGHIKRHGKIVEIGAQQLSNDFLRDQALVLEAEAIFGAERGYAIPTPSPSTFGPGGIELQSSAAPFARDFWLAVGFDYTAIDVDGSPGSVALDLNFDSVPSPLRGAFDLVTNLGTTEHICNQLNAFKAIHDLAAPGGVMVHHLPAGGALNHGLFNYNPKFFWHLARSNDYTWLYATYYGGPENMAIPDNIRDFTGQYEAESARKLQARRVDDYGMQIAFKKRADIEFVPPIDVDTGTKTDNAVLRDRYWTVFQPDLLASRVLDEPPDLS